ncbi:MAG: tetratricopeptide repeat protein [Verrucomicrobia bacterium]|nr:tetratricopeptide repeat protein [Verrucomicrobiota bacterium]
MQDKQHPLDGFVHTRLPWIITGGAFLVYAITLNHWVTLDSLPYVAKVTGWDWVLPLHAPLFFLLTFPIRGFPEAWQPIALNLFAAVCSALSLGLLARSVSLLPHDRTHAQRQRERSEFSFLTIPAAWVPPLLAALACGLQLTYWEHSVAVTNEALSLLVFAYSIRCLLEYRVDQRESWLTRLALVYGVGVTNNWAMIGFFPLFLFALVWIKGASFFQIRFMGRMAALGAIGLLLYLLLPAVWAWTDSASVGFWQSLKAELASQKAFLLRPDLRSRALLLSLTSILPVFILGIRWPSSFGDTSAAGAMISNLMFRLIHVVLLAACVWTVFDQKFSPRALVTSRYPYDALLTFHFLTALSIGYLSGYVLLVFGPGKDRPWKRRGQGTLLVDRGLTAAVWLALIGVPGGLIYKNLHHFWNSSAPLLKQFAEQCAAPLPAKNAIVLSDDLNSLLLLEAHMGRASASNERVLVHSRSLPIPEYHRQLVKRYPARWPDILAGQPQGEIVDDVDLLATLIGLSQTNEIYYLHPSFGFYFEKFYPRPLGLASRLVLYPTNLINPPPLTRQEFDTNQLFWRGLEDTLNLVKEQTRRESRDALFLSVFYSRAANDWGVSAQRFGQLPEAGRMFELASGLNTNNRPARVNVAFNRLLRAEAGSAGSSARSAEDRLGEFRDWESMLAFNGVFDEPDYCLHLGDIFFQQTLFRQAALQFSRVRELQPTNLVPQLRLANVFLQWRRPDLALERIAQVRASKAFPPLTPDDELALARLEASAHFSRTNYPAAEQILIKAQERFPDHSTALEALARFYAHTSQTNKALATIDRMLQKDPGNGSALMDQATIHFNSRDYDKSLASLDRILQKDPKNISALLYKVLVHMERKDHSKALADVERVLEIEADNYDGLLQKGIILIETKKFEDAARPLTQLLKINPNDVNALKNRGIAHLQGGRLNEAQTDYEKLQRQLPKYHVPYYGLAEIAYRKKDTAAAIRNYEYYLKFVPEPKSAEPESPELAAEKKMVNDRLKELRAAGR